jgi:hypothetical protein
MLLKIIYFQKIQNKSIPETFANFEYSTIIRQFNLKSFRKMTLKTTKTIKDYNQALTRLQSIFDAKRGSAEGDELELLSLIIKKYEDEYFPIGFTDPVESINFRMEQIGNVPEAE